MRHKIENVIEWVSIPALLLGTVFTYVAAGYAPLLDLALCLTGAILAGRSLHGKKYFLAAGFIALAVAASPFQMASRIFLLMVGSSRVDLQACKLEYSIVSPK